MKNTNNLKKCLIVRLEEKIEELNIEIKRLESTRCGREEYKENMRKVKILKLRKSGAKNAITKWKAALV